jgi:hypothetical protein
VIVDHGEHGEKHAIIISARSASASHVLVVSAAPTAAPAMLSVGVQPSAILSVGVRPSAILSVGVRPSAILSVRLRRGRPVRSTRRRHAVQVCPSRRWRATCISFPTKRRSAARTARRPSLGLPHRIRGGRAVGARLRCRRRGTHHLLLHTGRAGAV